MSEAELVLLGRSYKLRGIWADVALYVLLIVPFLSGFVLGLTLR